MAPAVTGSNPVYADDPAYQRWLAVVRGSRWIVSIAGAKVGRLHRTKQEAEAARAAGGLAAFADVVEVDQYCNPVDPPA